LVGVYSICILAGHGALYLVWKTDGALQTKCIARAKSIWRVIVLAGLPVTLLTARAQPALFSSVAERPILWFLILVAIAAIVAVFWGLSQQKELVAFGGSCAFIAALLLAPAGAPFPKLLRSPLDSSFDLDVHNGATAEGGLTIGIFFWVPALILAIGYFAFL